MDCLTIITAVSTATTAVAAIVSAYFVYKQWLVSRPSIRHNSSGDSNNEYRDLSVHILEPDDKKWFVCSIKVITPAAAKVANKVSDPATNRPKPGTWLSHITFENQPSGVGVFYSAPSGSEVDFEVVIALVAKSTFRHTYKIRSQMHQFAF